MKILLLNPPNLDEVQVEAQGVPLGLLHIKEFLRQNGCHVDLMNLAKESNWSAVQRKLNRVCYDIVGITCYTPQRHSVIKLSEICKAVNPSCFVVLGGPHATFLDVEILERISSVDSIIRNEGEYAFLDLVTSIERGDGNELRHVKGLTYRCGDGVIRNPPRCGINNLSDLPPLRYTPEEVENFRKSKGLTFAFEARHAQSRVACIINSRGCGNACLFCCNGAYWEEQHYYSPEYVFRHIKYLHDRFNIRMFDFSDDDFLQSKSHVRVLCDLLIASELNIQWWCAGRAKGLDRDLLAKMKKAGCFMVSFGFESGSPRVLSNICKNISVDEAISGAQLTKDAGLMVRCTLTVGNPGEDEQSIAETSDFLSMVKPDQIGLYVMKVYPGTPIYNRFKAEGGISDDYWFDRSMKDLPFYTAETPLARQIEFRNQIRNSLQGKVVSKYSDNIFHLQHLFLEW